MRLVNFCRATVFLGTLLVAACGGGGGGGGPSTTPPPSGLSYSTPQTFTVGQAITALNPTVTGTVSSYTISPALPAGLAISATTGVISGTPNAISSQAEYTVTASNSAGSVTADIMVTVNDVEPAAITYPASTLALATDLQAANLTPTQLGGGTITSWSVSPALPAGLSFSSTDGSISGTPTAPAAAAPYTISANNSGGKATFVLTLSVQSGGLLDLGHADPITVLRFDGSRVFSLDRRGHWVLWNYATGANIVSGDTGCGSCQNGPPTTVSVGPLADFAGQTIAIETPTGFEIRSPVDGHVTATISTPLPTWWKLATDGSYLVGGNAKGGLQVWSAAGAAVLSKAQGTYSPDTVFAAPGELRAAIPFGGQSVVETTSLATGLSSNSPSFNGTFAVWFVDGNRFLTNVATIANGVVVSNTVYTYSAGAVQEDVTTIQLLGLLQATGNWFGSFIDRTLTVYHVGASGSPAASYSIGDGFTANQTMFIGSTIGTAGSATLSLIDLSGSTPTKVDRPLPYTSGPPVYAALSATQWLSGDAAGVLFDGASTVAAPRYLDYGAVWSIAGSGARFAISTASGRVLHFDAATKTLEGTIRDFSPKVQLSTDGTVLAASGASAGNAAATDVQKTRVYSLPGEALVSTWPANNIDLPPTDIDLSGSGTVLGQVFASGTAAANLVTGGAPTWTTVANCGTVRLSPDGSRVACSTQVATPPPVGQPATQLFSNGGGVTATVLNGLPLGWLDNGHLLTNKYKTEGISANLFSDGQAIYDPTNGSVLGAATLPELSYIQIVTPDLIFSQRDNAIFSVSSSTQTWTSTDPSRGIGAVAGSNVVFASGNQVLALPR